MPHINAVEVKKSKIHGNGVFTTIKLEQGEKIFNVADIQKFYNRDDNYITPLGRLINHQKKGNCILKQQGNYYFLYAERIIEAGEELTSNYEIAPLIFSRKITGYKEL